MLFVLFGTTAEVGRICREWFSDHGIPLIQKKNYVPSNWPLTTFYDSRNKVSRAEVEACDYVYENNGMLVGFDKAEILDAVKGRCDRLLTGTAQTISFVESIKRGFGEYVTTICVYIEQPVLERITSDLPGITDKEVALRSGIGMQIKGLLRDNRALFDEVLLYSGEGTAFDYRSLGQQLDQIVSKAKTFEKKLNDLNYVEAPYTGGKPYLFVSYAHEDRPAIESVFGYLQGKGCRVWYDDDMVNWGGQDWRDTVFEKLDASTQCILFSSARAARSYEVDAELSAMISWRKPFITVRIDECRFKRSREPYIRMGQVLRLGNAGFYEGLINSIDDSVRVI